MKSHISNGVRVNVETFYQQDYSNPLQSEFMFAYRVTLENINLFPAKLLSRMWHIFDSDGSFRMVEGDGVVGMQPVIPPGEEYQYVSGCNLHTEIGRMDGQYTFENCRTHEQFKVQIPQFSLITPFKNN